MTKIIVSLLFAFLGYLAFLWFLLLGDVSSPSFKLMNEFANTYYFRILVAACSGIVGLGLFTKAYRRKEKVVYSLVAGAFVPFFSCWVLGIVYISFFFGEPNGISSQLLVILLSPVVSLVALVGVIFSSWGLVVSLSSSAAMLVLTHLVIPRTERRGEI